jgi:hypothetical protein
MLEALAGMASELGSEVLLYVSLAVVPLGLSRVFGASAPRVIGVVLGSLAAVTVVGLLLLP